MQKIRVRVNKLFPSQAPCQTTRVHITTSHPCILHLQNPSRFTASLTCLCYGACFSHVSVSCQPGLGLRPRSSTFFRDWWCPILFPSLLYTVHIWVRAWSSKSGRSSMQRSTITEGRQPLVAETFKAVPWMDVLPGAHHGSDPLNNTFVDAMLFNSLKFRYCLIKQLLSWGSRDHLWDS